VVMGDGMADWLGYGLEEAFTDNPEFGVVRKVRANSGLIRNETRTDSYDWVQSARDMIAAEKPQFVVMMIGLHDRQSIRERRPVVRPGQPGQPGQAGQPGQPGQPNQPVPQGQQKPPGQPNQAAQQGQQKPPGQAVPAAPQGQPKPTGEQAEHDPQSLPENAEGPTQPEQPAGEPAGPTTAATHEFRSDKWGELYAKRVDETIAALKSKGIPVLWVGLPPIRGPRSRSDLTYLNDLYRARAQKAGITYVDVWDGFVDEDGNFSLRGPDYNGQIRQLRSADGTYFTKAGALKLGHYLEREIQRLHATRATPVALPAPEPQQPTPTTRPGVPAPRPVAGPVVPLTGANSGAEELAGSGPATRSAASDPVAARVLVNGDPAPAPNGRADDFRWPRPETDDGAIIPAVVAPAAAPAPPRSTKKGSAPAEKGTAKKSGQAASSAAPSRPVR